MGLQVGREALGGSWRLWVVRENPVEPSKALSVVLPATLTAGLRVEGS